MPATAPAAPNGNTVIRVGVIESVEDGIVFVETLDGSIPVHLTSDSIIQEFADGPLGSLAIGQRVTVIGQETEAGITARAVIVSLEDTSLFQDQGDFPIGRGSRAFVGIIESVDSESITVSTKLGLRTAAMIIGETVLQMPAPVSKGQLSPGQLVTLIGKEDTSGSIAAQSVLITPELGRLMSAGRSGRRGGRGGASTAAGGTAAGPEPTLAFDTERQPGIYDGITFAVTGHSQATFRVREQLALIPLPHHAEMTTEGLVGEIHLDGRPSIITIDLHSLRSNQNFRDQYVRRTMFPDHPAATFTLDDVGSLPSSFGEGGEIMAQIAGTLEIRGVDFPISFNVMAQDHGDMITIRGRTKFAWDDLDISPPTAGLVLTLGDEVEVKIELTAKPLR